MLEIAEILNVDNQVIINALDSEMKDFEDAIQCHVAQINGIDAIITRNKKDFKGSLTKVYTPSEYLIKHKKIN